MALSCLKKLPALLRGITSKHDGDFYCLNHFHSSRTGNKREKHRNVCEDQDCYYIEMLEKDNRILKYNHGEKSMKVPFIIYADLESSLEKMNTCHKYPEKSSTTKINKHTSLVIRCLHTVHLIQQKISLIIVSAKTVLKFFVKI